MPDTQQPVADEGLYFPPIETHLIRSKYIAQTFKVQVMRPARRRGDAMRYPVVYATDGNLTFDVLKGISYSMQSSAVPVSPFILVGIGYPGDFPWVGSALRVRDMTFPGFPKFGQGSSLWADVPTPQSGARDFGGGEDFQRFIAHELVPFIDERFEAMPGDRTYLGHSAGGSFGLFTLFTLPQLFRNYVVVSPALSFDGMGVDGVPYRNHDFMLQKARGFIGDGRTLNNVLLYMAVGAEEEFEAVRAGWQLTSSFYRMVRLVKEAAIPGLALAAEVLPSETHSTAWPIGFIHGIRTVFSRQRPIC